MSLPRRFGDQPYVLLTLTSLFWAGNAVVGRAVADRIPPIALSQLRWTLALLLVLPFAWRHLRQEVAMMKSHAGLLVLLSLTGVSAFNAMLYWSLHHTTAINATLMQSIGPLMIGLWSWMLFREPLTRRQLIGILVSLAGVAVVVSGGDLARLARLKLNVGDMVIIAAIAIYALYSALLRKRPAMTQLSFLAVTIAIGAALLVPFTIAEQVAGAVFAPLSLGALAAVAYVAVVPSILAYLFFNRGVQLIGANRAGPFMHLIPLFGALLAVMFLGEQPGVHHGIGAVLIVGGVFLASRMSADARNRVAAEDRRP
jgi:drug/metabolite transporter (DMT)-like permease